MKENLHLVEGMEWKKKITTNRITGFITQVPIKRKLQFFFKDYITLIKYTIIFISLRNEQTDNISFAISTSYHHIVLHKVYVTLITNKNIYSLSSNVENATGIRND